VRLPASILSNNGAKVVSNNGGGLVSDQVGAVLSNNGATIISDRGGGIVSDRGGGVVSDRGAGLQFKTAGRYGLRQALASGAGQDLVAIANAQVGLFDARGEAVRDASGAPFVTTTDAEGRYAFPAAPQDRALVAVVQLAGTAGQAAALVPKAGGEVAIDLASSVMTSYVISKFARTQPDPQAALERLPAALEARARLATAEALARGGLPRRLEGEAAVAAVESLRKEAAGVDSLYEAVRRAMVIAGQLDLGEGQLALTQRMIIKGMLRTQAGRWRLLDEWSGRLWEVVDGRLRLLAGSGAPNEEEPADGAVAREAALGAVLTALRLGPDGTPWLLKQRALYRMEEDGRLGRVWHLPYDPDVDDFRYIGYDVLPLGGRQALILAEELLVAVGGAPEHPLPAVGANERLEVVAGDRRPDGVVRVVTRHRVGEAPETFKLWRLRPGAPPEPLPGPSEPHWFGFDDAGDLVTATPEGELAFHPADGGPPLRIPPAVTATWPEDMVPMPRGRYGMYPPMRFGGDARAFGWAHSYRAAVSFGPDGRPTVIVAGDGEPGATGHSGPSALSYPGLLAMAADGSLFVQESSVPPKLLRIVDGRAEPLTRLGWPKAWTLEADPGAPYAFTLVAPALAGALQRQPFGVGYDVPLADALFKEVLALKVAADGSLWLLDSFGDWVPDGKGGEHPVSWAFVRRIQNGRMETVAVKAQDGDTSWIDMVPGAEGGAVVLEEGDEHVRLLRVKGAQPPVELVRIDYADAKAPDGDGAGAEDDDVCVACQEDGMAPLPGGAWLLRVQGVLFRWAPGAKPVRLGWDGIEAAGAWSALMAASADGKVAMADERRVYRLDPGTGKATPVVGFGTPSFGGTTPDTGLLGISGLAVAPNGDLLISDEKARQVKRVPARDW
jgi:hypothetical protein